MLPLEYLSKSSDNVSGTKLQGEKQKKVLLGYLACRLQTISVLYFLVVPEGPARHPLCRVRWRRHLIWNGNCSVVAWRQKLLYIAVRKHLRIG